MFNMISLFNAVSSVEFSDENDADPALSPGLTAVPAQDPATKALVTRTIEPGKSGQVKFQGTWWNARCEQDLVLLPGQTVYVISEWSSIPLIVEPAYLLSNHHLQGAA